MTFDDERSRDKRYQPRSQGLLRFQDGGGEKTPRTHRYDTHVDWSEDIDILTLVVIGPKLSPFQNGQLVQMYLSFPLQLKRNYRRLNIPRVVSTIHGN